MARSTQVNRQLLNQANELLRLSEGYLTKNWDAAMKQHLKTTEYTWAKVRLNGRKPQGALIESMGSFRRKIGFDVQSFGNVMEFLKAQQRILQFGQGKGKVLVVTSTTPIVLDDIIDPTTIALDPLTSAELNGSEDLGTRVLQLIDRLNIATSENLDLKRELKDVRKQVGHLNKELDRAHKSHDTAG